MYPILNIVKEDNDEYLMNLYLALVKLLSIGDINFEKKKQKIVSISYMIGLTARKCNYYNDKMVFSHDNDYKNLNKAICHIIAKHLYENIENKPFTIKLNLIEEKNIDIVKFYIKDSYFRIYRRFY